MSPKSNPDHRQNVKKPIYSGLTPREHARFLAHLALPRAGVAAMAALTALAIAALWAAPAKAADTMSLTPMDAKAAGKVSSAEISRPGEIFSGISINTSESVMQRESLNPSSNPSSLGSSDGSSDVSSDDKALLRDGHRGSLFLGAALNERVELTLGLHGSFEHVKPENRDELFAKNPEAATEWRQSTKETGFSGASLFAKLQLLNWQSLKLAFAPFIESGAGSQATYSLTRSVSPKAGWMGIATYGDRGVAELSLNGGFRYRQPEEIGDVTLRNEAFYGANLKAYLTHDIGFFVGGQGRRLMVAKQNERDPASNKLAYKPQESGELNAGLMGRFGQAELSVYGGSRLKKSSGFGFGKAMAGLSVSYALGNYRGYSGQPSLAKDIERENKVEDAAVAAEPAAKADLVNQNPAPATGGYNEMIGADIDPLQAISEEKDDDFAKAKQNADAARQQEKAGLSEDEKVEAELKAIKAAEEKAEIERAKADQAEAEASRAAAIKRTQEETKLMNEWQQEAQKDVDSMEGISKDEMEWRGLE